MSAPIRQPCHLDRKSRKDSHVSQIDDTMTRLDQLEAHRASQRVIKDIEAAPGKKQDAYQVLEEIAGQKKDMSNDYLLGIAICHRVYGSCTRNATIEELQRSIEDYVCTPLDFCVVPRSYWSFMVGYVGEHLKIQYWKEHSPIPARESR
ncbi:MAG: hypothetical protein KJ709_09190 [Nanoarchaeota archaeon]|nr:hypothetical protein [Nanoarchaeota archaeon]